MSYLHSNAPFFILTARRIDEKIRLFASGFEILSQRLRERFYTSVQDFSRDLSLEIGRVIARINDQGEGSDANIEAIHNQLNEVKPGTAEHHALSQEQKEIKRHAKRLVKAVKELLEDALLKEAQLKGREHEEALRKLDSMGIFASTKSIDVEDAEEVDRQGLDVEADAVGGASPHADGDTEMRDADEPTNEAAIRLNFAGNGDSVPIPHAHTPTSKAASSTSSSHDHTTKTTSEKPAEPLSPPISTDAPHPPATNSDANDVFAQGGVPWYLEPFDPEGTTIHDERYTGRAVLRDMSEELSDMDEDTLTELAVNGVEAASGSGSGNGTPAKAAPAKKKASTRKKGKGRRWR